MDDGRTVGHPAPAWLRAMLLYGTNSTSQTMIEPSPACAAAP